MNPKSFVKFDRVVSRAVGRWSQSFLDAISEANTSAECPLELKMFVDKRMLFKVEVSDANLYRNRRNYIVKKSLWMTVSLSGLYHYMG